MGHVNDGTSDPGRRTVIVRPTTDWKCPVCRKALRYYWVTCPNDGASRPERS